MGLTVKGLDTTEIGLKSPTMPPRDYRLPVLVNRLSGRGELRALATERLMRVERRLGQGGTRLYPCEQL